MELFATDMDKLGFLLEAGAKLLLARLDAEVAQKVLAEEAEGEERPKYVATYVGSKQKLLAGQCVPISTMASARRRRVAS